MFNKQFVEINYSDHESKNIGKLFSIIIEDNPSSLRKIQATALIKKNNFKLKQKLRVIKVDEKLDSNQEVYWGVVPSLFGDLLIASTCHGAQLLISAKATKGKKISGYYSIQDDINNSGAEYVNKPVVVDKNIVSSPHYNWMGEWMKAAIEKVKHP